MNEFMQLGEGRVVRDKQRAGVDLKQAVGKHPQYPHFITRRPPSDCPWVKDFYSEAFKILGIAFS